jgi:electron transport complex protein RnfC
MSLLGRLMRKTFANGVHPPAHKDRTAAQPIRRLPFAPQLLIPLSQHIGRAAVALVHPGQEVVRGEPIARADGFLSVPIHAPATGVIREIRLIPTARGPKAEAIVLDVYAADSQRVLYGGSQDVERLTPDQLIEAIQECGMVGLGGAAFPTHAKLATAREKKVETLIVNGCECEPYLTTDHRLMLEWADDLRHGIQVALRASGAQRAILGIEDNKLDAVAALRASFADDGRIAVEAVKTKYPQGSAELLIKVLLDREVPAGGRSYDVGVVVQNIATLAELGKLLPKREGLIERVVTISGPGIRRPGNYLVPLGTPLAFVLDQVGFTGAAGEIVLGGPMMGSTVGSLEVPVIKAVSGILALQGLVSDAGPQHVYPCISCGECLRACPMHLNPSRLGLLAARREYEAMAQRFHLDACFECGSCTYVCPANIPLVHYFRIAKGMLREKAA